MEWFAQWGGLILSALIGTGAIGGSVKAIIEIVKTNKKLKLVQAETKANLEVTQQGIVEAFKTAKIPTDLKVNLSKQVTETLSKWKEEFMKEYAKIDALKTRMMAMILQILSYTAASNKLTEEQKAEIEQLLKLITENDGEIVVNE
mgnify:CR=1 FL=1|jgi:hypothetical protein